jgi:two-component system response regulator DesR
VVADDHPAVLDSVSRFLRGRGIDVVASVLRSDDALREIGASKPSVALLDIAMQPMSGIEVARGLARVSPGTRTVLYTGHRDGALLEQALDAGAHGFVLKDSSLGELAQAIVDVAAGGTYVDPEIAAALASASSIAKLSPLTPREREVLVLLADGLTNEKVADRLGISPETVQSHVGHAMTKLEADTRTQAVATAIRQSVIA